MVVSAEPRVGGAAREGGGKEGGTELCTWSAVVPHRVSRDCELDRGQEEDPPVNRQFGDGPERHHDPAGTSLCLSLLSGACEVGTQEFNNICSGARNRHIRLLEYELHEYN